MEIKILPKADEDLLYWKQTGNKRIMNLRETPELLKEKETCKVPSLLA